MLDCGLPILVDPRESKRLTPNGKGTAPNTMAANTSGSTFLAPPRVIRPEMLLLNNRKLVLWSLLTRRTQSARKKLASRANFLEYPGSHGNNPQTAAYRSHIQTHLAIAIVTAAPPTRAGSPV